jgi:hypothetical protein
MRAAENNRKEPVSFEKLHFPSPFTFMQAFFEANISNEKTEAQ